MATVLAVLTAIGDFFSLVAGVLVWLWRTGPVTRAAALIAGVALVVSIAALCLGDPWYFSYPSPSAWVMAALSVLAVRLLDAS